MEVAARPTHNFAVPSPTSLQFSSQTFKKRAHGDHLSADGSEINGSWTLRVEVVLEADCSSNINYLNGAAAAEYGEDVIVKHLRVLGDMHVGRVQADLVKSLNADLPQIDLSEHKFWWPANKQWLTKARYTLDQYGLNAECSIEFKTARRPLTVQLPDLQLRTMMVDFSVTVFRVVIQICKELKLRHPEELSLMRLLSRDDQRLFGLKQQDRRRKPAKLNQENAGAGTLMSPMNGNGEPRWTVSPTQTLNTRTMSTGKTPTSTVARTPPTGHMSATFRQSPGSPSVNANTLVSSSPYYPSPMSATMSRPAMLIDSNGNNSPAMNTMIRSRNGASFEPYNYNPLQELISTPPISITEASLRLTTNRPRGIIDKAFANSCWLDSSKSLLEQGIEKNDRLMLRFKFYSFFDLKATKPNAIRLNQLYEHAKWSILGEEIDATDEEAFSFAGLQYQIRTRQALDTSSSEDLLSSSGSAPISSMAGPISPTSAAGSLSVTSRPVNADDVDAAITQLQVQLETGISTRGPVASATLQRPTSPTSNVSRSPASAGQENLQEVPELKDFLKISRKSRFGLNKFSSSSPYWLVLRDLQLSIYRSKDDAGTSATTPLERMKLVNCEVQSTVRSASERKFVIRLFVPHSDGMTEIVLKAKNVQQYAVWLAAFRLASRGKTMADASYDAEVQNVLSSLTSPSRQPAGSASRSGLVISSPLSAASGNSRGSPNPLVDLNVAEYLPQSVIKRYKQKEIINRILEAHSRVSALSSTEAKIAYIKQWEALPYFDVSYFLVRIVQVGSMHVAPSANKAQSEQMDVMGVCPNKLIRYDSPKTMSIVQVWPFERITSWQVDWEKRVVRVESEDGIVAFTCTSCDCKVFHELLGGYIFMALRSSAQNKQLDEEMFQKLTGGRE